MELHFLRDRLIHDKNSSSTDIMRWDMSVMFAKSYVLQLSDNVKRSLEQARKEGIRAGLAPLGYLNVIDKQGNKDVIPDPDQRHLIVKMFELCATGKYSYREIMEMMRKLRLKSKQGQPVIVDSVQNCRCAKRYFLLWDDEVEGRFLSASS